MTDQKREVGERLEIDGRMVYNHDFKLCIWGNKRSTYIEPSYFTCIEFSLSVKLPNLLWMKFSFRKCRLLGIYGFWFLVNEDNLEQLSGLWTKNNAKTYKTIKSYGCFQWNYR